MFATLGLSQNGNSASRRELRAVPRRFCGFFLIFDLLIFHLIHLLLALL